MPINLFQNISKLKFAFFYDGIFFFFIFKIYLSNEIQLRVKNDIEYECKYIA